MAKEKLTVNAIWGLENIKILFVFVQLSFSNFLWSKLFMSFLVWPARGWVQLLEKCGYRPWCLLVKNTRDSYKYTDPASSHSQGYYPDVRLPCLEDVVLRLQTVLSFLWLHRECKEKEEGNEKYETDFSLTLNCLVYSLRQGAGKSHLCGVGGWARKGNVEEEAEAEEETMKLNVSAGETIGENVKGFGKRGEWTNLSTSDYMWNTTTFHLTLWNTLELFFFSHFTFTVILKVN